MNWSDKQLYRLPEQAMVGGVCAGLARYFEIDVALVRAIFVGSVVFGGFGVVVYLTLWLLLDEAEPPVGNGEEDDVIADLSQNPMSSESPERD